MAKGRFEITKLERRGPFTDVHYSSKDGSVTNIRTIPANHPQVKTFKRLLEGGGHEDYQVEIEGLGGEQVLGGALTLVPRERE